MPNKSRAKRPRETPRVSIIIRTRNEERWIAHCLRAVYGQSFRDFEVVLVDNRSDDGTRAKAGRFPVVLVDLETYRPGLALNTGIRAARGEIIVCLSGHCVPADEHWLERLVAGLDSDPTLAGVYGRQLPMRFSDAQDKRDLLITFGLDRRLQIKDSFFHNANSAIRRALWESHPFDEQTSNIEDRIWAAEMIRRGHRLLYEPEAAVYHHHGIHHAGSASRAQSTVEVLERLERAGAIEGPGIIPLAEHRVLGVIPAQGELMRQLGYAGLDAAIQTLRTCRWVTKRVVLTDCEEVASHSRKRGAEVPLLRDPRHGSQQLDLGGLYAQYLPELEARGFEADLVVSVEPGFRQRPAGLTDRMLELAASAGYDSVAPVVREYGFAWLEKGDGQSRVDAGDQPRPLKHPLLLCAKGLGIVTRPEVLRRGRLLGDRVGLVEISRGFVSRELGVDARDPDAGARRGRERAHGVEVRGPE